MRQYHLLFSILVCLMSFSSLSFGSSKLMPEKYFKGNQLNLARQINGNGLENVRRLAITADLNTPGHEGMTLLMYSLLVAADSENDVSFEIISQLVKAGADPLYNIPDYGSAAEVMATTNDPRYLKAMIDGGLDKNAFTNYRPLIINATSEHSRKVLEYLVSIGVDVNKPDSAGKTALMVGLGGYDLDEVEYLLSYGADPNVKNKAGWGFREMLQKKLSKVNDEKTEKKLNEIKVLAERKGMIPF